MSLSNPKVSNPCKKFIEFKASADAGYFQYWDKEEKKNIEMDTPVKFIVLDELCTITGFSDSAQAGIYSNEVRDLKTQVLNVRAFKSKISVMGIYDVIKGDIKSMGGKFCRSVYVALFNGNELELACLKLTGIAFKAWLDREVDLSFQGVVFEKSLDGKKGAVHYKIPVYEALNVSKELMAKAIEMDKELQAYLNVYQKQNENAFVQEHPEDDGDQTEGKSYNEKAITPASAKHRGEPESFDEESPFPPTDKF